MTTEPSVVPSPAHRPWSARLILIGVLFEVGLVAFIAWWYFLRSRDSAVQITFDGSSDQLQRTVIAPTLDTRMPEGKNVIWCSSFQVAWNKLKTDLAGGPVQVRGAESLADQLNKSRQSEADLPQGSFYTAAGRDSDGIAETIGADMGRLFPGVTISPLPTHPQGITAYAYLQAGVPFKYPFFEEPKGFKFADGAIVGGFGLTYEHERVHQRLRDQVAVLYSTNTDHPDKEQFSRYFPNEYALDLCRSSQPNQLVLARVKPRNTLGETLADLQAKIDSTPKEERGRALGGFDTLRVPNMRWRIEHHFHELEGPDKALLNPSLRGLYIDLVRQIIEFRMDRSGAELASEAAMHAKGGGPEFYFDRPFLLYIKKRDAEHPFFVMWVENDELLQKRG